MKTRMLLGIIFFAIEFMILGGIGLYILLDGLIMTRVLYNIIFVSILVVGLNILFLVLILTGSGSDASRRVVSRTVVNKKEDFHY